MSDACTRTDRRRRHLAVFRRLTCPNGGTKTTPWAVTVLGSSDRDCFEAILFRLVTGCSWDVAGRLGKGSETTLRRRRDEWVAAGAFQHLVEEAINGFDKIIGLDLLSEVSVDGSLHKAPMGGEGTGTESYRPGQDRMEVVGCHRHQRSTHRLGRRSSVP